MAENIAFALPIVNLEGRTQVRNPRRGPGGPPRYLRSLIIGRSPTPVSLLSVRLLRSKTSGPLLNLLWGKLPEVGFADTADRVVAS